MPGWARWRTVRARLRHIADTESRYYLPSLGLPTRPRAQTLVEELHTSHQHVTDVLGELPPDLAADGEGEWTSTKLLRRLAWHEAGELRAIEDLLRSRG